jgi:hypothetical protein
MRCQCVVLPRSGPGSRIHVFGFASDIERADVLYTSLLVQMWQGLVAAEVLAWSRSPRAWRRSWLLGFATAVVTRVRAAEQQAAAQATAPATASGSRAALVLADRTQVIKRAIEQAYPLTRKTRLAYSGSGYGTGYAKGQEADLCGPRLRGAGPRALGRQGMRLWAAGARRGRPGGGPGWCSGRGAGRPGSQRVPGGGCLFSRGRAGPRGR